MLGNRARGPLAELTLERAGGRRRMTIASDGHVQSANASGGEAFPGLAMCVQGQVKSWKFPPPTARLRSGPVRLRRAVTAHLHAHKAKPHHLAVTGASWSQELVSRVLFPPVVSLERVGNHSSRRDVTARLQQPTREASGEQPFDERPLDRPIAFTYAALLRVGFAVPRSLPSARWALTPPFHPYP